MTRARPVGLKEVRALSLDYYSEAYLANLSSKSRGEAAALRPRTVSSLKLTVDRPGTPGGSYRLKERPVSLPTRLAKTKRMRQRKGWDGLSSRETRKPRLRRSLSDSAATLAATL